MECCCRHRNSFVVGSGESARTATVRCPAKNHALLATSGHAAAGFCRLIIETYCLHTSALDAPYRAAGRLVSAGFPPRPLTRFRFDFSFRWSHVPFVGTPSSFFPNIVTAYFLFSFSAFLGPFKRCLLKLKPNAKTKSTYKIGMYTPCV